ncbi:transmembrane emp24 domain-containing protein p24delta9 [Cajanus cajan]|uniref:Transmembrane emp24 domain-containing protein 10 n=1 Tax=Cajanus cajan TaxID=3821 RepID=A0A151RF98_CAJCA|nr:transmembrane emp24 domain-containing protein p24delta9 [Cajanus cajan]KYP41300.1 Transmembrane emp24 domain-containing protein 10 [Cajanus cajan]
MSDSVLPLALLTLTLMCSLANSMRFELQSDNTKCITEDIKTNAMSVGKYSVVNPNEGFPFPDSHRIVVKVSSPHGNSYHYGDHVDSGNFAFTAAEAGDYSACFWIPDGRPAPAMVTVDFEWRSGVAAKDWSKVAKKGQIEVMEFELKKLYDTVQSIHDEMYYLREREEEMQDLNKSTNSKMFTFSFLSIVICLSVAGLQLWHLKAFFERKKLL